MPPLPGIQYKTGTNELGGGGTSTDVNPFAINSQTLAPQTSFNYTSPQQTPIYPVSGLNTADLTPQEGKASTLSDQLQQFNDQLLGESQYRSQLEQQQGLPELQKTQSDLNARLNTLKNEALAIPLQLQNESQGLGRTSGGLQPLQTAALRNNAIQSLSTASLLEASRGNITLAQDLVDRSVAQKYDPIRERINAATKNLELILKDPRTTLQDKKRAEAQKAIQDQKAQELAKQVATEKEKHTALLEYAGIADSQTLREMQNAPDAVAVFQIALQKGLVTPEQARAKLDEAKTRADIERIRADTSLTNAQRAKILAETVPVDAVDTKKVLQQNEALTLAKELLKPDALGKSRAVGASTSKLVPFGMSLGLQPDRAAFDARVETLKANLTLDNLKLLKGAMSDKDLLFLNAIGSSLNTNMSEKAFDAELTRIVNKLESAGATSNSDTTSNQSQAPAGYYLASDGKYYKEK